MSKNNLKYITTSGFVLPGDEVFALPEKVLQFGTGVLLRGLPDYFINEANRHGIFNGRILVVKSTSSGSVDAFDEQDGLYTHCIKGVVVGSAIEQYIVNASISRVLSATTQWRNILDAAANPDMQIIISNTTEVGISLVEDDIQADPPKSFPGKLLAFLYERYSKFDGDITKGMVIIPTELVTDNGKLLRTILLKLSEQHSLEPAFIEWLSTYNYFCNSLVDRIVPGKLEENAQQEMQLYCGYTDDLMIMSEVYRLWAIETSEPKVKEILNFSKVDSGVVIAEDIELFKELKLRILNGSHTFTCGLALLCGFRTVKEAMQNEHFASFITALMMDEIAPAIANQQITVQAARDFAGKVIDRYRNPYIEHQWISISAQYSLKMRSRNIPIIKSYSERFGTAPRAMVLGFAAFLIFMKGQPGKDGKYFRTIEKNNYVITDEHVSLINDKWDLHSLESFVKGVLTEEKLWGMDLSTLPEFENAVLQGVQLLQKNSALNILENIAKPAIA